MIPVFLEMYTGDGTEGSERKSTKSFKPPEGQTTLEGGDEMMEEEKNAGLEKSSNHGLQSCASKLTTEEQTLRFQGLLLVPPDVSSAATLMQLLRGPLKEDLLSPGRF